MGNLRSFYKACELAPDSYMEDAISEARDFWTHREMVEEDNKE